MNQHRLNKGHLKLMARFILTLCLMVFFISTGFAAGDVKTLTLDEALTITLDKNRDIQKAEEYKNKVRGMYVEQRAAALPQITGTAVGARSWDSALAPLNRYDRLESRNLDLTLTQPIFTWGQVEAAIRAAKFGIASADDQLRLNRQAALRDVSAAFYDALLAKEFSKIAQQSLEQKTKHLDETRRKFAVGIATEYDVLAAEVAVENAKPEAIKTENQIRTSREKVRFLLGISEEEVDVAGQLFTSIESVEQYEEARKRAYEKRPELAELRNRLGLYTELVKVAGAGNKPRLDLKATAGYKDLFLDHRENEYEGKTWSVGLIVTIPFFDGFRTKGKVAQARSDVASLKIDEAKLLDSISLQIRDTVNAVKEAGDIARGLAGTVSQAEKLLQMAEKGYEYGVKTRLEVEDAELNLSQARGNLARAYRDYLVAKITLRWAMGTLGE